jgi:hypothetical protein
MTQLPEPIRAGQLLHRAAREIALCRSLVSTVEHAFEHLPGSGWHPDLQGIDLLHQTLDDIATLLRSVADEGRLDALVFEDADRLIAPLRLGAVRARLRDADEDHSHDQRTFHVELF